LALVVVVLCGVWGAFVAPRPASHRLPVNPQQPPVKKTTSTQAPPANPQQPPVKKTTSTQARPVNPQQPPVKKTAFAPTPRTNRQQLPVKKTTSTPSPPKQAVGAKRATSGMPPKPRPSVKKTTNTDRDADGYRRNATEDRPIGD
jgi:hypothetical protein